MRRLKPYGYLLVFLVPALLPAAWAMTRAGLPGEIAAWFPMFFLFVLLPLGDRLLGLDRSNPDDDDAALERAYGYRLLTWLVVPVWLALLAFSAWAWTTLPLGLPGSIGWLLSTGVVGGVLAINTAHELIHKTGRLEPALGGVLLSSVCYAGFKVEHLRGHHVHVSTPRDASSARYGETLYQFLPRALFHNFRNAWRLEAQRLQHKGLRAFSLHNELIGWYALSAVFALGAGLAFGPAGAAFFVAQGLLAGITLEVINYVEHYGLERRELAAGRYERVDHKHSWNSNYRLTNWMLFQLQRHSDHHANARRRYQTLRQYPDSPQLPAGYATMFLVAWCPPLWRAVVHPTLERWRSAA